MRMRNRLLGSALAAATVLTPSVSMASSHREAPFITKNPKVDGTDFYMFRSYETAPSDRSGYTTLIANYQPLQDTYGGPNYFNLDPDALYEIHIDNDGDGIEDLTFQFDFDLNLANNGTGVELPIGGKNLNRRKTECLYRGKVRLIRRAFQSRERVGVFAFDPKQFPAGRKNVYLWCPRKNLLGYDCSLFDYVLATIKN